MCCYDMILKINKYLKDIIKLLIHNIGVLD